VVIPFFFLGQYPDGTHGWRIRMPYTHDMFLHYDQMRSFYSGMRAGKVYPRWEEDTNHGFGAPTTIFYPPGIYYVTALCHLITSNWTVTLLLAQLMIMVLSGTALYLYARRTLSRSSSTLATALYVVLPYHLTDQYQRGAIAELLGFVWMPLILLSLDSLFRRTTEQPDISEAENRAADRAEGDAGNTASGLTSKGRMLAVAGLAVSYGGFLWSHPPTAYQFGLTLALLVPLLAILRRDFKGLVLSGFGVLLAAGLSAAYLYPASVEKGLINSQFVAENWPYHESYVFMRTQYMLDHWQFFSLIEKIWCLNLGIIVVCFGALTVAVRRARSKDRRRIEAAVIWLVAGVTASFMMTHASYPISRRIPMIDIGVFSWRMLSITTLSAALLAGAAADSARAAIRSGRRGLATSLRIIVAASVLLSFGLTLRKVIVPSYIDDVFVPETEHINYAMMPASVDSDPEDLPDDEEVQLDNGNGIAVVRFWEPEHRLVHVELDEPDSLFIRTFDYPGWTAHLDGKPLEIQETDDLHEMEVDLPAGTHELAVDFLDTVDRRRGRDATLISVLAVVFIGTIGWFKRNSEVGTGPAPPSKERKGGAEKRKVQLAPGGDSTFGRV
ncbi:MAG TPA: 6-pyruvoyl-tetrahydropterin synthase-related protein, partial [Blastocatellia bacterium]|nr:6-pyruvoyl-tetrahydropterin synthase-related protein [Blastocatellia bacterium]